MKKKTLFITALLALCVAFAFAGCGGSGDSGDNGSGTGDSAKEEQQMGTGCQIDFPAVGYGFDLPEGVKITNGYLYAYDVGEVNYNSGVMMGWPVYVDVNEKEFSTMMEEKASDLHSGVSFHIVCVKDAANGDEAIEKIIAAVKDLEGEGFTKEEEELYRGLEELHKENGYIWMVARPEEKSEGIRKECQAEYDAFYDATDEILKSLKYTTPHVWQGGQAGADVTFETSDLDGERIDSKELFAQNKVTMINIWATTCGPCIQEMPEIEKMSKEWAKKGGAVVGLVEDVPVGNNAYLEDAKSIVEDTGVTYINLRAWDGFDDVMSAVGTPTTYFVDSNGKLIGEPILGASPKKYKEAMEKYLSEAE